MTSIAMGSNPALLRSAIEASGLSARRFAVKVLAVDERTVRRWLAGDRDMPGPAVQLCRLVLAAPDVVSSLAPERVEVARDHAPPRSVAARSNSCPKCGSSRSAPCPTTW